MKILNIFFIFIFILSALLQYNDPDPVVWMSLYLYGAFVCYTAIKKKFNLILYIIGLCIYSVYAIYVFFDVNGVWAWLQLHQAENIVQSMKAEKPWIELTREFFGLLILIFALSLNMIWLWKRRSFLPQSSRLPTEDA